MNDWLSYSFRRFLGLNIGTVPMFKMHHVGTDPTFKMHLIGTVLTFKKLNMGTLKYINKFSSKLK